MTFANEWILHFLWAMPLFAFVLMVQHRRRQRAMDRFAEQTLLKRLTPEDHKGKRLLKALLLLFALGTLIFALAGPRWGSQYQEVSRKGVDIMVLVDVSRSMMVEDVKPNRLERATREIIDFLKVVEGDRVGLTAFAGAAFVQCPLTLDYAALKMFLNVLQPGIIPVPGTDLGTAIETGLSAFDAKTETDKVMLLITDGEDNENRGLEAARKAADQGAKIFIFGIGDPSGGPIPAGNDQGGFKKDKSGNLVLSKLDEKTLQDIAMETGGGYVRSMAGDLDLDILYFDGIKQKTEAQTLKSGKIKVYEEHFNLFILAAFLLLLFEELLDGKRRANAKRKYSFFIVVLVLGLTPWLCLSPASAAETPDELYRQGRYEEAEQAYSRHDMDHPKDIRFRYNRGCAAFQNGQYEEASAAFSSVTRRTENEDVRFKAAFNLGNTAFKQGDYASASTYYKQALADQPDSEDARYNLELSLRALKKEKEEQDQEQTDTPQSDKPPQGSDQEKKEGTDHQGQGEQSPDKEPQQSDQEKEDPQKNGDHQKPDDQTPKNDEKEQSNNNENQASAQNKPPESIDEDTLSGDLKPRETLPEIESTDPLTGDNPSDIDRKKAEALLDNIQENPSGIMRFMLSDENRKNSFSGKDW
jgi:Ca-activated chloride channel family protein